MDAFLPLAWVTSPIAWVVILVIGLLLFGRRLPGVARNLGSGINEFKKGLHEQPVAAAQLDEETDSARRARAASTTPPKKTEIEETSV